MPIKNVAPPSVVRQSNSYQALLGKDGANYIYSFAFRSGKGTELAEVRAQKIHGINNRFCIFAERYVNARARAIYKLAH